MDYGEIVEEAVPAQFFRRTQNAKRFLQLFEDDYRKEIRRVPEYNRRGVRPASPPQGFCLAKARAPSSSNRASSR
jgi:hypothetical protein